MVNITDEQLEPTPFRPRNAEAVEGGKSSPNTNTYMAHIPDGVCLEVEGTSMAIEMGFIKIFLGGELVAVFPHTVPVIKK
jgi:hypothetical protein